MSARGRRTPFVLLLGALALSACADDPSDSVLAPDDDSAARAGAGAPAPVTVMTRNLYLGADFGLVLQGRIPEALQQVSTTLFPLRVPALAQEIMAVRPHLVGLQEVTTYEFSPECGFPLSSIDYIDMLTAALGGAYTAYYSENVSVPVPAGGGCVITYTDADAILVRAGDVEVYDSWAGAYDAQVVLPQLGNLENERGYQWVDVSVAGQRFFFVNTHLEVQGWAETQEAQTAELLEAVDELGGPVILVGDFNSAANPGASAESKTATYDMVLDAGFDDLWLRHHGKSTGTGLTFGHAADLSNEEPSFDQRIDFIFARNVPSGAGYAGGVEMDVVGEEDGDDFLAYNPVLGTLVHLWPSDHAGLHATLWMPPGLMARR
jgi:endonuclease/exonuclease/phosphatase family metal-dependent hydrolase